MLVALCFVLTALALRRRVALAWGPALALAGLLLGLGVVGITVLASLGGWLTRPVILGWWSIAVLVAAALWWRSSRRSLQHTRSERAQGAEEPRSPAPSRFRSVDSWVALTVVVALGFLTLVVALLSVPRVYDALAYQAPRVFYWLEQQSVAFFPAHDPRQNYVSPFSGYLTAHLLLLHPLLPNAALLVQWFSYLGTVALAALFGHELDRGWPSSALSSHHEDRRIGTWLTIALVASLPNLVLQAQTGLSDVVSTFWALLASWTFVASVPGGRADGWPRGLSALAVGSACGLAFLAKASVVFLLLPLGIWWFVRKASVQWRRALGSLVLVGSAFLLVNAYHFTQSTLAYGNPLGTGGHASYLNEDRSPAALLGSLAEHVASQATLPVTRRPIEIRLGDPWNRTVERTVRWFEQTIGTDAEVNNLPPGTRFELGLSSPNPPVANSPQSSGSPAHFLLGALAVGVVLVSPRSSPDTSRQVALVTLAGFLLLALFFRWQPWLPRFHLPFLVIGSILAARYLLARWPTFLRTTTVLVLGTASGFFAFHHQEHSWSEVVGTPRSELYLEWENAEEIARRVSHLDTIGIMAPENVIEFSILQALDRLAPEARILPVFAELPWRGRVRHASEAPEAIVLITQYREPAAEVLHQLRQHRYREVLANPMARAFVRRRR